jgi:putative endonuclease
MAAHNELGKLGEELALAYLLERSFQVLYQNWRSSHQEIDIIATKAGILHFIEVKLRTSIAYGSPEAGVNKRKFNNLVLAANEFLFRHPGHRLVQFDILSITKLKHGEPSYYLIEDVWF